jgi:hypothetical protein
MQHRLEEEEEKNEKGEEDEEEKERKMRKNDYRQDAENNGMERRRVRKSKKEIEDFEG